MSINFSAYIQRTYRGQIYAAPFKASAVGADPMVAPVQIQWTDYASALTQRVGVNVNLAQNQAQGVLDQICSVIIDNLQNTSPVYVQFPDTGYVVKCPANARVCAPCVTNYVNAYVFTDNIQTGNQTRLFFSNIPANYFDERADPGRLTSRLVTGPDGTFISEPDVHGELTTSGRFDASATYYGKVFSAQNLNTAISGIRIKTLKLYTQYLINAVNGLSFQISVQTAPAGSIAFNTTYANVMVYAPPGRGAINQQTILDLEDQHISIPSNVDLYVTIPQGTTPTRGRISWFFAYTYV